MHLPEVIRRAPPPLASLRFQAAAKKPAAPLRALSTRRFASPFSPMLNRHFFGSRVDRRHHTRYCTRRRRFSPQAKREFDIMRSETSATYDHAAERSISGASPSLVSSTALGPPQRRFQPRSAPTERSLLHQSTTLNLSGRRGRRRDRRVPKRSSKCQWKSTI